MVKLSKRKQELKNGLQVWIRPIRVTDTPYLLDIFKHLSPNSRYNRFQISAEGMSVERIEARATQTAADSVIHGFGLIAFANHNGQNHVPLGGARFYTDLSDPDSAELALTIRDDMQQLGLGKLLLKELIEEARRRGIIYLTGIALAENDGLWNLLASTGLSFSHWYDGSDKHFRMTL